MNSWLVKAFVKNYENTNSPQVRSRYGELSGMVGIVTNLFICTGKFVVGLLFSSISIVADAVNNLTDAASSLVTVVGFKISGRPADKEHPFGHVTSIIEGPFSYLKVFYDDDCFGIAVRSFGIVRSYYKI